jgi:hypothetical protein
MNKRIVLVPAASAAVPFSEGRSCDAILVATVSNRSGASRSSFSGSVYYEVAILGCSFIEFAEHRTGIINDENLAR